MDLVMLGRIHTIVISLHFQPTLPFRPEVDMFVNVLVDEIRQLKASKGIGNAATLDKYTPKELSQIVRDLGNEYVEIGPLERSDTVVARVLLAIRVAVRLPEHAASERIRAGICGVDAYQFGKVSVVI